MSDDLFRQRQRDRIERGAWPWVIALPLIRRSPTGVGLPVVGFLTPDALFGASGRVVVYLADMFAYIDASADGRAALLARSASKRYDTMDAFLDDGWEVD